MKRILPILLLTIMLRVWFSDDYGTTNGILIGSYGDSWPRLLVRADDGTIFHVSYSKVTKSKWVEIKG